MLKLKEIEKMFYDTYRTENGQKLCIYACNVGENGYEYGEPEPPITYYPEYEFLRNDPRILLIRCDDCCQCGSW